MINLCAAQRWIDWDMDETSPCRRKRQKTSLDRFGQPAGDSISRNQTLFAQRAR